MVNYFPQNLVEFVRDGLVEQEHQGFVVANFNGNIKKVGKDNNYPFFLRSCAKPLQASILIDLGLDEIYDMTSEEIAICCASHAGEDCHIEVLKNFLNKTKIDTELFKCGIHQPLSKTQQEKMLLNKDKVTVLHNNCSGKHAMMLCVTKSQGFDIKTYDEITNPLQQLIKNKIYSLCEIKKDYPITKDGCGVPIHSMPLENMLKGYLNLFLDEKYSKIKDAFLKNPYIIGGEDRLDTAIIKAGRGNLVAKVGAGGLCIVINLEEKSGIIIKISDCDMKARAVCIISALKQLNWVDMAEKSLILQNKKDILTLHGEKIGEAKICFSLKPEL